MHSLQRIFKTPSFASAVWTIPISTFICFVLLSLFGYYFSSLIPPIFSAEYTGLPLALFAPNSSKYTVTCSCEPQGDVEDDQGLFQEALLVSECAATCRIGKGKLALLFLTRGSLPLAPLWARFLEVTHQHFTIGSFYMVHA